MATVDRPTRAATRMSVATLASRGIGFVRVWVIAAVLGTTYLGNAYQSSSSVSNVLFELLAAGALSAVLVPSFVPLLESGEDGEAERLASGLLGLALAVMGAVCIVGVVFAPQIAELLASGVRDPKIEAQQVALSTFLLRFFVPQVLLYVLGTVATAILIAKRRFVVTAVAPIANTVMVVSALIVFRVVAGPDPGLELSLAEKLILAFGGLLGVAGFVGVPVVALIRSGFRFRPSFVRPDARLRRVLHLSAWAVLQHAGIGILLGTAIVMGNRVEGGVIAYQFAFVAFMAAYSILAQPVHTTILPDISLDASRGDTTDFADRVRWALDRMAVLVLPVSAAYLALALPAMKVIAPASSSPELLAAALASLGAGLFVYSAFLLLARAFYALGDSRVPALIALGSALLGAAVEIVGVLSVDDPSARVAMLGVGHSAAYLAGAAVLFVLLRVRLGHPLFPHSFWRALLLSAALGGAAWAVERAIEPRERLATAGVLALIGVLGVVFYVAMLRMLPKRPELREQALEPTDPDLAVEL
jgi:putative peptidoglycan lipid II flippase